MADDEFGKLLDVDPRKAWKHEAHNFTPWLAENLERLGDELGIELELIRAEASLPTADDSFSADILARNVRTDENVLIENQLEGSDHTHLGQILTYLSGLEAKTVVWVAPNFRDAHLAAINWLNDHTHEEFTFFAVRVRVVQIGSSPLAPLFEVLEKPNAWERRVQSEARAAKATSELGVARKVFWQRFQEKFPPFAKDGPPGGNSNQWRKCNDNLIISYYLHKKGVALFVRGGEGQKETGMAILEPYREQLAEALGTNDKDAFHKSKSGDFKETEQFGALSIWLKEQVELYETTINTLLD